MVAGLQTFKHDYVINDHKLMYKDNDTLTDQISYGYKTVFANLFESERNNVSNQNL
jgi:hypothetical protein